MGEPLSDDDIRRIKEAVASSKAKDGWDKTGVVAQLLSSIVIAALAVWLGFHEHESDLSEKQHEIEVLEQQGKSQLALTDRQGTAQYNLSKTQGENQLANTKSHDAAALDLESRKNVTDFLAAIKSETFADRKAELLGHMDAAVNPASAVKIALSYAHPPYDYLEWFPAKAGDVAYFTGVRTIADKAMEVLARVRKDPEGAAELRRISVNGTVPDREIAKGVLGVRTHVLIKASNIDDVGDIFLYQHWDAPKPLSEQYIQIHHQMQMFDESEWMDVSKYLVAGNDALVFQVKNNSGACSGRFQVSAGTEQYDTGPVYRQKCPDNNLAFSITVHLRVGSDGKVTILDRNPVTSGLN